MEIERKYFLKNDEWRKYVTNRIHIKQGYICSDPDRVVRIRITDSKAFITIKGMNTNISRPEFEYEIPVKDAEEMYSIFCQKANLEKFRNIVMFKNHKWEIDEFAGRHQGLIFAEVELQSEDEKIEFPDWIGQEITGIPKYYNSNLVKAE